jgi:hypothetical protein
MPLETNPIPRTLAIALVAAGSLAATAHAAAAAASEPVPAVLPARYDEHRFFVEPVTADGKKLVLYTDTGGGLFLFSVAVERLGLAIAVPAGAGGEPATVELPAFRPEASIPAPAAMEGRLPVMPAAQRPPFASGWDGMLGQQWFAGRVWTFDYPGGRLLLWPGTQQPASAGARRVALGFRRTEDGAALAFPRIDIAVAGETLDVLFDTGATTRLTAAALAAIGDGGGAQRATSFVTRSAFDRWRAAHPKWRVVEAAEDGTAAPMIEVPEVAVAGHTVGPVWFTVRPDANFHEFMSQFTDRRVEGAIGGNALRHFRVTVSYPGAYAELELAGRPPEAGAAALLVAN